MPPEVRDSEPYRRAGLASQDFRAWYNDLCSLQKELAAGDVHNIDISLIHHKGLTRRRATLETRHFVLPFEHEIGVLPLTQAHHPPAQPLNRELGQSSIHQIE